MKWSFAFFLLLLPAPAHAQEEGAPESPPRYPDELTKRPLTLPAGFIEAGLAFSPEILGPAGFKRFPVTPFGYYGITDSITAGIATQNSFCFGEECLGRFIGETKVFNDLRLDARVRILEEKPLGDTSRLSLAFHGGIDFPSLTDPFAVGPRIGALARLRFDKLALVFDPSLYIGVSARDRDLTLGTGTQTRTVSIPRNREHLDLPIRALYQVTPTLAAYVMTGLNGGISGYGFGSTWRLPLGVGATITLNHDIDLFGSFTFTELAGAPGVRNERLTFSLGAAFRFDTQKPKPETHEE